MVIKATWGVASAAVVAPKEGAPSNSGTQGLK